VGTEGCGKTVFITTLAKRLGTYDPVQRTFLVPTSTQTQKYVEQNWRRLAGDPPDWPLSTPQGTSFDLQWTCKAAGLPKFDLRIVDMAGHDLRLVFSDDSPAAQEQLPAALLPLVEYCRDADIVMFMVNLKDFVGEGDPDARINNDVAMCAAMRHLMSRGKRCCLIFTQADQYEPYVAANGGWMEVARKEMHNIYGTFLAEDTVPVFPVACVADTQMARDEDGQFRPKPKSGFRSTGMQEIFDWMQGTVEELTKERERAELAKVVDTLQKERDARAREQKRRFWRGMKIAAASVATLFVLWWLIKPPPPPPPPYDEMIRQLDMRMWLSTGLFHDDLFLANKSPFPLYDVQFMCKFSRKGERVPLHDGVRMPLEASVIDPGAEWKWTNVIHHTYPTKVVDASARLWLRDPSGRAEPYQHRVTWGD
jgi:hypothetical protein